MENYMIKKYNEVISYLLNKPELFQSTNNDVQDIIEWYRTVGEYDLYLLNKTKITLTDLQQYMLKKLVHITPAHDGYYDNDGYAGKELVSKIKNFWENIDESRFESFITGEFASDELDLNGGRFYLIDDMPFKTMVFNYIFYQLGWTDVIFEAKIVNSTEFIEELHFLFPPHDLSHLESVAYTKFEDGLSDLKKKRTAYEESLNNLERQLKDKVEFDFSIEYMQSDGFCLTNYNTSNTAPLDACIEIIKKKGTLSVEDHDENGI